MARHAGVESAALEAMSVLQEGTAKDVKAMVSLDASEESVGQALTRLSKKGLVHHVGRSGHHVVWGVSNGKGGTLKKATAPKKDPGVSMPDTMTRKLNLRIHQKSRAISFEVEGWSIMIGFDQ